MPRSNGETLAWYEDCLLNGKVSEEKIKQESIKFFQLTTKESAKSKQLFKKIFKNSSASILTLKNV